MATKVGTIHDFTASLPQANAVFLKFDAAHKDLPILDASEQLREAGILPEMRMASIMAPRMLEEFEEWMYEEYGETEWDEAVSETYVKGLRFRLPLWGEVEAKAAWLEFPAVKEEADPDYHTMPFTLALWRVRPTPKDAPKRSALCIKPLYVEYRTPEGDIDTRSDITVEPQDSCIDFESDFETAPDTPYESEQTAP
jgi:hypothetical protein